MGYEGTAALRGVTHRTKIYLVYLNELPDPLPGRSLEFGVMQLMGLKEEALPDRARQLVERTQQELTDVSAQRKILELVETVLVYRFPDLSNQEIATMLGINELKQTRVYQDALQEGRQAEALAFVTRLLTRRFGTIAPEVQSQLQQLTSHQLEDLGEALLDFTSPEDLTTWLQSIRN